jgi:hypothetical protein
MIFHSLCFAQGFTLSLLLLILLTHPSAQQFYASVISSMWLSPKFLSFPIPLSFREIILFSVFFLLYCFYICSHAYTLFGQSPLPPLSSVFWSPLCKYLLLHLQSSCVQNLDYLYLSSGCWCFAFMCPDYEHNLEFTFDFSQSFHFLLIIQSVVLMVFLYFPPFFLKIFFWQYWSLNSELCVC